MRITFVVAALDFSGGLRVIAQYAEGLRQRGHEVRVISPAPYPNGRLARIRNSVLPSKNIKAPSHFDGTQVPVTVLERFRPIGASDVPLADILIATWWETAEWISSFPENRGKKIHFVQDYEIWNGYKEKVDASLRLPIDKITISTWLEKILVDQLDCKRPMLVLNGVDRNLFRQPVRHAPTVPTVGFVYAPNSRKGTDIAIQAVATAKQRIPNLRCIAFGHKMPIAELPLPEFVEYHASPPQVKIREIYGTCSAWLFSSREEGFGLPILEALACGTPVLATPAGAAPDILPHGGGVLLDSYHPNNLADEIINLLSIRKEEWKNLSSESLNVASTFSLENSIERFSGYLHALKASN